MRWSKVAPDELAPGKRSAHTAQAVDGRWMYVFGGWNGTEELGDVSRFNLRACGAAASQLGVVSTLALRAWSDARGGEGGRGDPLSALDL